MHRDVPPWAILLYVLATLLILFSLGPASCALTESYQLQRVRDAEFPTVEVDLSTPGITTVPITGPFRRRGLIVRLVVPGEVRASEYTVGGLSGTFEIVPLTDGETFQWPLEDAGWADREDASVAWFYFPLYSQDAHELRLTVVEPAARLKEARIEVRYQIDSMDGALGPVVDDVGRTGDRRRAPRDRGAAHPPARAFAPGSRVMGESAGAPNAHHFGSVFHVEHPANTALAPCYRRLPSHSHSTSAPKAHHALVHGTALSSSLASS